MNDQLNAPAQPGSSVRSGVVLVLSGVICFVGLYGSIYLRAAEARRSGQPPGPMPWASVLVMTGMFLVGAGIHRVLWSPPRGENLAKGTKQLLSLVLMLAAVAGLAFIGGVVVAVLTVHGGR